MWPSHQTDRPVILLPTHVLEVSSLLQLIIPLHTLTLDPLLLVHLCQGNLNKEAIIVAISGTEIAYPHC